MTCRPLAPPADGTHIVVGATGAVGRAVVRRLVGSGRPVLAIARDKHALATLENDLVRACVADLGSDDAIGQISSALADGPIALALFAAGLPVTGSADAIEPTALAHAAGFKAAAVTRLMHALRDLLGPGSRFMAVAGSLGFEPGPHDAAPGTANAALVNLMRQISRLLGPRGVVVHTIAPGPLDTPRLHAIAEARAAEGGQPVAEVLAGYRDRASLGCLPTADEVAWLVETLLAPEAAILHGSVLSPDAGARHAVF